MNEPVKCVLQLYISSELKRIAKSSGMNLSKEFEEWLKIRLNQVDIMTVEKSQVKLEGTPEEIIMQARAEILKQQSVAELKKEQTSKDNEEEEYISMLANNIINIDVAKRNLSYETAIEEHLNGIVYVFKKRFNKDINTLMARDMLEPKINQIRSESQEET